MNKCELIKKKCIDDKCIYYIWLRIIQKKCNKFKEETMKKCPLCQSKIIYYGRFGILKKCENPDCSYEILRETKKD